MGEALQLIKYNFKVFGNQTISLSLVCIAILFLLSENRKRTRVEPFLKYVILFFLLLVNPFVFNDVTDFWFGEDYWKMFMALLPVLCIAVAAADLIAEQKRIWQQVLAAAGCVAIVIISMNFKLHVTEIVVSENRYKVTDEIYALDELLRESDIRTERMIAPREVCAEIREINAEVNLLYGEDLIERIIEKKAVSGDEEEQIYFEDCASIIAVPESVRNQIHMAQKYGSNCIVLETSYDQPKLMQDAGYHNYGETNKYVVYVKET